MVLEVESECHNREQYDKRREYDSDDFVLLAQIGHCALSDVAGDFSHRRSALVFLFHLSIKIPCEHQCNERCSGNNPKQVCFHKRNEFYVGLKIIVKIGIRRESDVLQTTKNS